MTLHAQAKRPKSPPVWKWDTYLGERTEVRRGIRDVTVSGVYRAWPTLVIGSGCTSTESQFASLDQLAQQLARTAALRPALSDVDGRPMGEVVWRFIDDLVADRVRRGESEDGDGKYILEFAGHGDENEMWLWLVELVVAAALLTKLYYRIKALSYDAPRRPDHEEFATLSPRQLSWAHLNREYIQPCLQALRSIGARDVAADLSSGDPNALNRVTNTVEGLLDGWKGVLSPALPKPVRIKLLDVQALAEFAWFCLTAKAVEKSLYPGWSDMLLDLSNHDSLDAETGGGRVGVPLFTNMNSAANLIRDRYWSITTESLGGPNDLFQTVASLLIAQNRLYGVLAGEPQRVLPGGDVKPGEPPIATAFVTSFDIELALALLREGEAFAIAFPINIVVRAANGHDQVIQTCWLALQVPGEHGDPAADPPHAPTEQNGTPDQRLESIHRPSGHLSVLTKDTRIQGPLVVHLAGCPLVILPELDSEGGNELQARILDIFDEELDAMIHQRAGVGNDGEESTRNVAKTRADVVSSMKLWHAIILNEHDAVIQNALDLLPRGTTYGLPSIVAKGRPEEGWSRYWMLLGVQIRDSAIRQRIATLISSLPHHEATGREDYQSITSTGVAVNNHVTELEEDLLFWSGFDVVRDNVVETTPLLGDFAEQYRLWTKAWDELRA